MKRIANLIICTTTCTGTIFAIGESYSIQSSNQSASTPSEYSSGRLTITPRPGVDQILVI